MRPSHRVCTSPAAPAALAFPACLCSLGYLPISENLGTQGKVLDIRLNMAGLGGPLNPQAEKMKGDCIPSVNIYWV